MAITMRIPATARLPSLRVCASVLAVISALTLAAGCGSSGTDEEAEREARTESASGREQAGKDWSENQVRTVQMKKPRAPGRWRGFRTHRFDADLTEEQRQLAEQLESIGYLSGSREAPELMNVTVLVPDEVYEGLNFYVSGHAPEAFLLDMRGNVLHRWRHEFRDVWPDYPVRDKHHGIPSWRRAYLFENGDILAIHEGLGIIKLGKDSNLIWANPNRAHHDMEVMPGGDIYVLTREARLVPTVDPENPVLEEFVCVLDSQGNEKRRVSLLECFYNSGGEKALEKRTVVWAGRLQKGDILHTNTVEVLDGRIADKIPAFRAGNVLISMLTQDAIGVVDLEQRRMPWMHRGQFQQQHDPQILENGRLLLFDNHPRGDGLSAVLEYDPVTMTIVWEYRGIPEEPFFSETCGTCQRLPNGNTLMTESDNGRAIEVTPDKRIVWEFYNPHRAGENNEFIATLFEMKRLPPDFPIGWADGR